MAATQTVHQGSDTETIYTFSFPYLEKTDIDVLIDNVATTAFTFPDDNSIELATAPGAGTEVKIQRNTNTDNLPAEFFVGSAIRAQDLNDNFETIQYASQEAKRDSLQAPTALTNSTTALTTANAASADASAALAAVNLVVSAITITNVATLAAFSTANLSPQDQVAIFNSTGIENYNTTYPSAPQITGLPASLVGSSIVTVRLVWTGSGWNFGAYFSNDPDNRYYTQAAADARFEPLNAGLSFLSGLSFTDEATFHSNANIQPYDADTAKLDVAQTFTADQTFASTQSFPKTPLVAVNADRTLAASDAGKTLVRTAGDITFPALPSPDPGDLITIYNDGSTDCNLVRFVPTGIAPTVLQPVILKAGSTTSADFVLKPGGIVTVLMLEESDALTTAAKYVISGTGVL